MLKRAAVLIGVNKTGRLPRLSDAAAGARSMGVWARTPSQGIDPVITITDKGGGRVTGDDIYKAVESIVKLRTVDQLLIYFAGHGVNIGYSERWLLSGAPEDAGAAVNLNGSAEAARYCGIPHVVFISDTCRTAAPDIGFQDVLGRNVFPNERRILRPEGFVDQFWATLVGHPAAEIRDPKDSAGAYRAFYTNLLGPPLRGEIRALLEPQDDAWVVRPRSLKKYLHQRMSGGTGGFVQVPDARITSDPDAWVSRLGTRKRVTKDGVTVIKEEPPEADLSADRAFIGFDDKATVSAESASKELMRGAISGLESVFNMSMGTVRDSQDDVAVRDLVGRFIRSEQVAAPDRAGVTCGFEVLGTQLEDVHVARGRPTARESSFVAIEPAAASGASVLLEFANGTGAVLPAIPGFIGTLRVEDDALIDVAYEPARGTFRWDDFSARSAVIRRLRRIASASTASGVFRLEGPSAAVVARELQNAKGAEIALAIYAAYAYLGLQRRERIREMAGYLRDGLGMCPFDVAMLGGITDGTRVSNQGEVFPFCPLLSQGWALLDAHEIRLHPALYDIQGSLLPSVWTLFDSRGVERLRRVVRSGEVS